MYRECIEELQKGTYVYMHTAIAGGKLKKKKKLLFLKVKQHFEIEERGKSEPSLKTSTDLVYYVKTELPLFPVDSHFIL